MFGNEKDMFKHKILGFRENEYSYIIRNHSIYYGKYDFNRNSIDLLQNSFNDEHFSILFSNFSDHKLCIVVSQGNSIMQKTIDITKKVLSFNVSGIKRLHLDFKGLYLKDELIRDLLKVIIDSGKTVGYLESLEITGTIIPRSVLEPFIEAHRSSLKNFLLTFIDARTHVQLVGDEEKRIFSEEMLESQVVREFVTTINCRPNILKNDLVKILESFRRLESITFGIIPGTDSPWKSQQKYKNCLPPNLKTVRCEYDDYLLAFSLCPQIKYFFNTGSTNIGKIKFGDNKGNKGNEGIQEFVNHYKEFIENSKSLEYFNVNLEGSVCDLQELLLSLEMNQSLISMDISLHLIENHTNDVENFYDRILRYPKILDPIINHRNLNYEESSSSTSTTPTSLSPPTTPILEKTNETTTTTPTKTIEQHQQQYLHINTPLLESLSISKELELEGIKCYLKMDALQPSGSFKIRGIGMLCQELKEKGINHFIGSSGGNAGKSLAYAGRMLGVKTTIVLPTTIPTETQNKIRMENANVITHGSIWDEADQLARQLAQFEGGPQLEGYIHPFDNENLWVGHSTLIHEVYQDYLLGKMPKPDVVLCSVGGGGLLIGISMGLEKVGWSDIPIIATETYGSHSLSRCFEQNQHSKLDLSEVTSVCKTLATRQVAKEAWDVCQKRKVISTLVTDKEAVDACIKFADQERVLVEPACGASLAVVYKKSSVLLDLKPKNILVIVCGGNNTSIHSLLTLSQTLPSTITTSSTPTSTSTSSTQ
eukprot:gene3672-4574_t